MNKKILLISSIEIVSIICSVFFASSFGFNSGTLAAFGEQNVVWKHYSAIEPTTTTHGSKEFWANCSILGFSLTQPTNGTIEEGVAFDSTSYFDNLERTDDRYVPPLNEQWGITPVRNGNKVTYGLYPQTHVNDAELISELNKLTVKYSNGWYFYNNSYYAKATANTFEDWYYFEDGTTITNGTTYWFKCEPISWDIVRDHGNSYNYNLLTTKKIDAHRYNEYWYDKKNSRYANNYCYSEIRSWLNDDFYNSAFALHRTYVAQQSIDNSSSTLGYPYHESIYACGTTNDYVCLLSYVYYLEPSYGFTNTTGASDLRKCSPTDYAVCKGAIIGKNKGYYWTRSPDMDNSGKASYVNSDGSLSSDRVDRRYLAVRPSILAQGILNN